MSSILGLFCLGLRLCARSKQFCPQSAILPLPFLGTLVSGKLIFMTIRRVPQAPILPSLLMTLAPDVECEKLCWYSCYSWHSSARSETADSIPDAAGELSPCPTPPQSLPTSERLTACHLSWGSLEECSPPSMLSRQGLEDTRPRASGAGCYV